MKNTRKLRKDLTGRTFGKLYVIELSHMDDRHRSYYKCHCECGNEKIIKGQSLLNGDTKSCGCAQYSGRKLHPSRDDCPFDTRLYGIWAHMISRCYNPKDVAYSRYGELGLGVCDEWRNDVHEFMKWAMSNGYDGKLTLDRRDNSRGYSPDNCWFKTAFEQNRNRKNNRIIDIDGETKLLVDWCAIYNIGYSTVIRRINTGWSEKDAITIPVRSVARTRWKKYISIGSDTHTLKEWSEISGVHVSTIAKRILNGWDAHKAVYTPATK